MPFATDGVDEPRDVRLPALVVELDRVAIGQIADRLGQIARRRHRGTLDQHGDHANAATQRFDELGANAVGRLVAPPAAVAARGGQPVAADDGEKHRAGRDAPRHRLDEIVPRPDRVEIAEDLVGPELGGQRVAEPALF